MDFDLGNLVRQAIATLRDPRAGARRIMALDIPRAQRWELLVLVTVLASILGSISMFVDTGQDQAIAGGPLLASPLFLTAVQLIVFVVTIYAIDIVGRRAGGTGTLDDAIILVAWMQFILLCVQVVQTVLLFVSFPLAAVLGWFGIVLTFWLMTNFIAEMHGFRSLGAVFASMVGVMIALAMGLSLVLGILGISVVGS